MKCGSYESIQGCQTGSDVDISRHRQEELNLRPELLRAEVRRRAGHQVPLVVRPREGGGQGGAKDPDPAALAGRDERDVRPLGHALRHQVTQRTRSS